MAHGGRRQSPPGRVHPNRSDLTASTGQTVAPPDSPPGDEQGQGVARQRQQRALPVAIGPPELLSGPSRRPSEPVQAGLPTGPGPGPSSAASLNVLDRLRAIYSRHPNDDLARMIEFLARRGR